MRKIGLLFTAVAVTLTASFAAPIRVYACDTVITVTTCDDTGCRSQTKAVHTKGACPP